MGATRGEPRHDRGSRLTLRVPAALAGAAAMSMALIACGGSPDAGASASAKGGGSPVEVGYVLPLSGNFAANAKLEEEGFKLALKQFGSKVDGH
ncbi:MAG: hypothetical protein ACRDY3_03405, partial [Acidimicrobiales bacterium]